MTEWVPKTRLGKLVAEGKITTMSDALRSRLPLREPEVVDILVPDLADEVLDVNMVQRMTDSGRRVRFAITVVVGNQDGFVGLGRTKGKEVGPAIRAAIDVAKLNLIEVKRGCGSWECGCLTPHSLPFTVLGHSGSVYVKLRPAPRGTGLAVNDIAKAVLKMAGVKDAWGFAEGHTKTTINSAIATYEALKSTSAVRVTDEQRSRLQIMTGPTQIHPVGTTSPEAEEAPPEDAPEQKEGG